MVRDMYNQQHSAASVAAPIRNELTLIYVGVPVYRKQPSGSTAKISENSSRKKQKFEPGLSTRELFSDGEQYFIMDAKSIGNIGRYLNVSLPDLEIVFF